MAAIPVRFRAKCVFCPDPVDTRPGNGAFRQVTGWEEIRAAGGTNAIALRMTSGRYAHAVCIDVERSKAKATPWTQLSFEGVEP